MKMEKARKSRRLVREFAKLYGVQCNASEDLWLRMRMPDVWGNKQDERAFLKAFKRRFMK